MDIKKYQYIGFGSFLFDDFKILHSQLGILNMISLESNADICLRAQFNKPYKCIEVQHTTSSNFISRVLIESPSIFWLDYTDPKDLGIQFADFSNLIGKMNALDIVRITLNANPNTLYDQNQKVDTQEREIQKKRFDELRERIGEYIPSNADVKNISKQEYPKLLLSCLEMAARHRLSPSKFQKKYLFPLFSTVYADGQQMVTLTAIVLNSEKQDKAIQKCLKLHDYINFKWDEPYNIQAPLLTVKEIIHINSLLVGETNNDIKNECKLDFQNKTGLKDEVDNYEKYYKYYPNFHHVNL
ncbi:MAG: hypothetical protein LBO72_01600 [Helicobacteraceae bacterium]|nr:hypothetical protein [Helicobacteraceae bacterium]